MAFCRRGLVHTYKGLQSQAVVSSLPLTAVKQSHTISAFHQHVCAKRAASETKAATPFVSNRVCTHDLLSAIRPKSNLHLQSLSGGFLNNGLMEDAGRDCASIDEIEKEYKCPSRLAENFSQLVILDRVTAIKSFYECPVSSNIVDKIKAPNKQKSKILEGPGKSSPAKEAKIILRIRHKKMKKHKLKKLRKRMYFVWRKQKLARKNKRDAIYRKELATIEKTGEEFDPEAFVKEQLQKARKGGYHINVFESKS